MSSQGKEILSLAFGHYSCNLATHFFNIQEASFSYNPNFSTGINHDVLFRESLTQSYSPRCIIVDDQDSLGYLSRDGYYRENIDSLPHENKNTATSGNASPVLNEPQWERNEFLYDYLKEKQRIKSESGPKDFLLRSSYNLDESVVSWSDYLVTEYCNKTIVTLPRHTEHYEKYDTFSCFDSGISLWQETLLKDNIEENIRFFLEECDNLQGFKIVTDGGNGYSGISSGCAELIKDEYSKKPILLVPAIFMDLTKIEDVRTMHKNKCDRIYSLASSFSTYAENCEIIAPISHIYNPWSKSPNPRLFRNVNYKHDIMYHTSGILAAALDIITLPCRLQSNSSNLNSLSSSLNIYGRPFVTVGMNMPFPVKPDEEMLPDSNIFSNRFFESLTPMIDLSPEFIDIQSVSSKGLGKNQLKKISEMDALRLAAIEGEFKQYLVNFFPRVFTQLSLCKSVFRVPRTFPKIFESNFNLSNSDHVFGPLAEYIAVAGIHNTKEMYGMLNNIYQEVKGVKKNSIAGFRPRDSDVDHEELFDHLKNATQAYLESSYL